MSTDGALGLSRCLLGRVRTVRRTGLACTDRTRWRLPAARLARDRCYTSAVTIRAEDVTAAEAIQVAAAHAPEAQVRLVAGPGSGKSRTIEERVRWLLQSGVEPEDIAVVSFTNASVIDLRLRLREYCQEHNQEGIRDVSITTLHSLA